MRFEIQGKKKLKKAIECSSYLSGTGSRSPDVAHGAALVKNLGSIDSGGHCRFFHM